MGERQQRCERQTHGSRCPRPATIFAQGQHVCPGHEPVGAGSCSHSLAPSERCSFCGAPVDSLEIVLDAASPFGQQLDMLPDVVTSTTADPVDPAALAAVHRAASATLHPIEQGTLFGGGG